MSRVLLLAMLLFAVIASGCTDPAIRDASKLLSKYPWTGAFHDESEFVVPTIEENPDIFDASDDIGLDLRSHVGMTARLLLFKSSIPAPHHCDWDKWMFNVVVIDDQIVGAWLDLLPGSDPRMRRIHTLDNTLGCA